MLEKLYELGLAEFKKRNLTQFGSKLEDYIVAG